MTKESCYQSVTVKVTKQFSGGRITSFYQTPLWTLMMTDTQVVKRTVPTNDNNASQDFTY